MVMDGQPGSEEGHGEVNLVARVLYGIAVAELDLPHIVLTRSVDTGETTYSGPYDTGLQALAAAEAEWQTDCEAGGRGDISFHVAALYPSLEVPGQAEPEVQPTLGACPSPASRPSLPIRVSATASAPLVRTLVAWLRDSLQARRARTCRHCGAAPRRVMLTPAGSPHPERR